MLYVHKCFSVIKTNWIKLNLRQTHKCQSGLTKKVDVDNKYIHHNYTIINTVVRRYVFIFSYVFLL